VSGKAFYLAPRPPDDELTAFAIHVRETGKHFAARVAASCICDGLASVQDDAESFGLTRESAREFLIRAMECNAHMDDHQVREFMVEAMVWLACSKPSPDEALEMAKHGGFMFGFDVSLANNTFAMLVAPISEHPMASLLAPTRH
jgi:hypothetical protein